MENEETSGSDGSERRHEDGRLRSVELDVREIKTMLVGLIQNLEKAEERRKETCPYRDEINGCGSLNEDIAGLRASIDGLTERLDAIENLKTVRETQVGVANKTLDIAFKLGLGAVLLKGAETVIYWAQNTHK